MEGPRNFNVKSLSTRTLTSKGKLRHVSPGRKLGCHPLMPCATLPSPLCKAEMNLTFLLPQP